MKLIILIFSLLFVIANKCEAGHDLEATCKEQKDKWYYSEYLWVHQKQLSLKESRFSCCLNCLNSKTVCKSWMYNENTRDCYHSSNDYANTASVQLVGMYTGSVSA